MELSSDILKVIGETGGSQRYLAEFVLKNGDDLSHLFIETSKSSGTLGVTKMLNTFDSLNACKNASEIENVLSTMALEKFDASSLTGTLKYFDSLSVPVEDIRQAKLSCLQNGGFDTFGIRNGTADIAAFTNNQITVIETTDTLTLYRRGYNTELTTGLGKWWTDKPLTIDETRDQLAVLEAWGNPLTGEYKINVPKGTKVITGEVAPQFDPKTLEYRKGGGTQYWLNEIPSDWVE